MGVSIHAPVMGAKKRFGLVVETNIVSIHAPVMGANTYELEGYSMSMFQSTHP